jgi:pimeloyl-ACP methyl ester carboxylesterase
MRRRVFVAGLVATAAKRARAAAAATASQAAQAGTKEVEMDVVASRDGTRIAYERTGAGPAVVLVDGAFSYRANGGSRPLAALLADRFAVYAYDRRGRGDSEDAPSYAPEREVEDLAAVIGAAGGAAGVYGWSSGAVLALHAGASLPAITRLALFEPPVLPGADPAEAEAEAAQLAALAASGPEGAAAGFFLSSTGMPAEAVAEIRQAPFWSAMVAVEHTLAYDIAVIAAWQRATADDAVARAAQPTLVIDGGASFDWMGSAADALAAPLPQGRRRTLPDQTHQVDPAVLAPVLAAFFAG